GNWVRLRELEHPPKGLSYSLRLFRTTVDGAGRPGMLEEVQRKDGLIDLYSKWSVDHWEQPAFKVQITNTGDKDLYITSTSLGFDYRVAPQPFEEIQLNPGQSAGLRLVDEGTPRDVIPAQIDEEYKELGYQEITEYVKLFIGTEPIDVSAFEQTGLRLPSIKKKSFGLRNYKPEMDWTTETIGIRIFEPLGDSELAANQELRIGSIVIGPHAGLSGKVGLSSSALTARSADGVAGPHAANSNSLLEPFDLVSGTRGGSTSDVLELFDVKDPSVVTPDDPLVVELPAVTGMVMAIGYDEKTGLYYPLGGLDSDGKIRIETLPDQTNTDAAITQRSFLGSIKIYFQKIISDKLGIELGFQQRLAIPSVKDGKVKYESDVAIVSAAVAKASKILLFVHGIIGDTEGMAQCVDTDISGNTLKKRFDLVLTFDYENLETPIDETGIALQKCLKAVGLKEGHGKEFVIAAHSMGGLVSRWMIEKEGGHTFVSKLVMLGTPNNGTPWANVRDMADAFLTYAINGAAFLKPYLFILSGARKLFKGIDDNLQAMNAKSDFYKRLNTEKDPGIQYVIVAGDTSKIIVNYAETAKFLQRLFATVKKRGVYIALDAILFHKPNDIAVTDDSISLIPGADAWAVQPVVTPVACDHLNYFLTVTALGRIL
ncbi:MAG TPA: hypothetical protein VI233_02460, partial [Puia sp.]